MPNIVERRTNTIINKLDFYYNDPVSSSDLNEMQSVILENSIQFFVGTVQNNTVKATVLSFTDQAPGITITGLKYFVRSSTGEYLYGAINPSVVLSFANAVAGNRFNLYIYYRVVELSSSSTVYLNGIRSNPTQTSIVETTTQNNINDTVLGAVSNRSGLELTFVATLNASAPVLSDWSAGQKIAECLLDDSLHTTLINTNPASPYDNLTNNISGSDTSQIVTIDPDGNITPLSPDEALNSIGGGSSTCDSSASTINKVVDMSDNYNLTKGAIIGITFTNGNTASNPTLNVSGSGNIPIMYDGTNVDPSMINDNNQVYLLQYDGQYWQLINPTTITNYAFNAKSSADATSAEDRSKLLIDTADNNILKYWTGSAWTPVVTAWTS